VPRVLIAHDRPHRRDNGVLMVEPGAVRARNERPDSRRPQIGRGEAGHDVEDARELEDGKGVGVHGLSK
jgi:hypothetical protein